VLPPALVRLVHGLVGAHAHAVIEDGDGDENNDGARNTHSKRNDHHLFADPLALARCLDVHGAQRHVNGVSRVGQSLRPRKRQKQKLDEEEEEGKKKKKSKKKLPTDSGQKMQLTPLQHSAFARALLQST
jgi:hypothetical protein